MSAAHVSSASACGNEVYLNKKEANRLIAKAQKALDRGQHRRALRILGDEDTRYPSRLRDRRQEITAVAQLRLGLRKAALWRLRRLVKKKPNDPYLLTRYAEALGSGTGRKKALKILERLHTQELIADAEGFAALAWLRLEAKDKNGAIAAAARCRKLTRNKNLCPKSEELSRPRS